MSKRAVTFTKPEEPSFLRKLKEQVGYKQGPTVDTKREQLDAAAPEDLEDGADEQPTVVVLQPGDLSAEEAAATKQQLQREAETTPADLDAPIVFKAPSKEKAAGPNSGEPLKRSSSSRNPGRKPKKAKKALLSFDDEENDDQ